MKGLPVRRWMWHAKRHLAAFGWAGMAALLLAAVCAAFAVSVVRPLQDQVAGLRREAGNLRAQSKAKPAEQKILNPAEQLAAFYRFFPAQDTASDWMAKLYAAAAQQNLNLEQGEYRLAPDRDSKLVRYDIVLPVKGGYVQVRKFIAQALTDIPNLSLDGISFSRQKIGDPMVDAQLRFTLYLGAE